MESDTGQSLLFQRLVSLFSRVGEFWLNRSYFQQIVLVLFLLLAKNAFDIELRNIQDAYLPGAQEFPRAVGYFSASFGQVIIAHGLGVTTTTQWVFLHVVLFAVALGVAFYLISNADPERRSFMVLVLASATATSSLFISIGKYDVVTFLGAVVLALGKTLPGSLAGAFIMASGNPEQAIVASVALLVLSCAREFREARSRAVIGILVSMSVWLAVQFWFSASEMPTGRIQLLPEYLSESLARVVAFPGLSTWSWLNSGWLLITLIVVLAPRASRVWILAALVALPGIATVITADGGRVFGMIVLPAYLTSAMWFGRQTLQASQRSSTLVGVALVALIVLPIAIQGPGWLFDQWFGVFASFTGATGLLP